MNANGDPTTPAEHVVDQLTVLGTTARHRRTVAVTDRSRAFFQGQAEAWEDAADAVSKTLTTGEQLPPLHPSAHLDECWYCGRPPSHFAIWLMFENPVLVPLCTGCVRGESDPDRYWDAGSRTWVESWL